MGGAGHRSRQHALGTRRPAALHVCIHLAAVRAALQEAAQRGCPAVFCADAGRRACLHADPCHRASKVIGSLGQHDAERCAGWEWKRGEGCAATVQLSAALLTAAMPARTTAPRQPVWRHQLGASSAACHQALQTSIGASAGGVMPRMCDKTGSGSSGMGPAGMGTALGRAKRWRRRWRRCWGFAGRQQHTAAAQLAGRWPWSLAPQEPRANPACSLGTIAPAGRQSQPRQGSKGRRHSRSREPWSPWRWPEQCATEQAQRPKHSAWRCVCQCRPCRRCHLPWPPQMVEACR